MPRVLRELPPVVVLSTADFDADIWTNKQHLATRLSEYTRVVYIESFGLRAPRPNRSDLARIRSRVLRQRSTRPAIVRGDARTTLEIVRPRVIPLHKASVVRRLNHRIIEHLNIEGLDDAVLWTFSPLTYGLDRRARAVVYHSVDLLHAQPGFPARALLDAEARLVKRADRVVASSSGVANHLTGLGRTDVRLWENVADTQLFAATRAEREPRAIFAGNLTPAKIDIGLLLDIVEQGTPLTIAGPTGIDGTSPPPRLRALLDHRLTTYVGVVSPDRLAYECARASVGLIPYVRSEYTEGVFPLKVYEYLAAGLSVVSTPLPSLLSGDRYGIITAEYGAFAHAVRGAVSAFTETEASARRDVASKHSWERRVEQVCELIREI